MEGRAFRHVGSRGAGLGQFNFPGLVFADGSRVFVTDCGNHRVVVLAADGTAERALDSEGRGAGQLRGPRAVWVDGEDLFVADSRNCRVAHLPWEG